MTESIKIISKKEFLKKNKEPNQEEVWDEISDLWTEFKKKPFFSVEDFLNGKKGKIIDLGCGCGRNMIQAIDTQYYGIDISANQLKAGEQLVKEKGIGAKFFKSCANKLDKTIFKNEMFDYGLFIATLHCIEGEKERENALKELYRVLKKGAEGLISVWNSADPRFKEVNYHGDIYMSWKKDRKEYYRYYYLYSEEELINLIKSVGFKILEIKTNLDKTDSSTIASSKKDRFDKKNLIIRVIKK
ncbi:Ubiquinone/menaquinone biosynthesis C-methyltransferase UbiE [uncultured archaeon]|nr:Ubiquinone/menaquinone biosynthesis C-methyltransferase UbiE [uncultured archaeon]